MRVNKGNDFKWKHPVKLDSIDLHPMSIVDCHVDDEWDVSKEKHDEWRCVQREA